MVPFSKMELGDPPPPPPCATGILGHRLAYAQKAALRRVVALIQVVHCDPLHRWDRSGCAMTGIPSHVVFQVDMKIIVI